MIWADFNFIRPYWLLLLLPAIGLIILSLRQKLTRGNWADVCDNALLPFILQQSESKPRRWLHIVLSLASFIAIIALAGPTWERLPTPAFRNDSSLVIALDLSKSMDAADIKPSRLIRAHYKVADILTKRKDGLTALIAYAGSAYTVTPLTQDTATISNQLNALTTDIMPNQGINTGEAIQKAINLMQQAGQLQGDILLVTDGINSSITKQLPSLLGDYRLSVLAVGTQAGSPIKLADGGFLKDQQGNIVVPGLKTTQLEALARAGDGLYRTISTDDHDINVLISFFEQQHTQSSEQDSQHIVEQWNEKGPWLLLLLLPLLALYFRKGLLVLPLVVFLNIPQPSHAFGWDDLWQTSDQQAQHAFEQKDFEQAAKKFQSPEWKAAAEYKAGNYEQAAETLANENTASSHYNRANSLAKSGELQQAIDAYQKALDLDANNQDAQYNKDLVEKALEQQEQEKKQDKDQKKDEKQEQSEDSKDKDSQPSQEQSDEQKQSDEQQPSEPSQEDEQKEESEQNQQNEQEADKADESEKQQPSESEAEDEEAEQEQEKPAEAQEMDESDRATEQWLKRIPDDPSGLLKRKFKYQYQQQKHTQQEQQW